MVNTNRIYGAGIVIGALCLILTGMIHPNVSRSLNSDEALRAFIWTNTAAHCVAMVGAWLSLFGFVGFSKHLGLARPATMAALTAYLIGTVLVCGAATMDGLVIPEILRRIQEGDEARRAALAPSIAFAAISASSLTTIYVAAVSLAVLLWSTILYNQHRARALSYFGSAVAISFLAALVSGIIKLNLHGLIVVVLVQGAWFIAAGMWLMRRADPV